MNTGTSICSGAGRLESAALHRLVVLFDFDASFALFEPRGEFSAHGIGIVADSTLPYNRNAPAGIDQGGDCNLIPLLVASQLSVPELGPCLGKAEVGAARMTVPEASMHEHDRHPFWQNQIRFAGEMLSVQPISEAGMPELFAHMQFRAGVLAPYT